MALGHLMARGRGDLVDDINPDTLKTLNYGSCSIFLTMGNVGFISSTVSWRTR